jgi:hypothetical protein
MAFITEPLAEPIADAAGHTMSVALPAGECCLIFYVAFSSLILLTCFSGFVVF